MVKRELVDLLCLLSWCLMIVVWLFLAIMLLVCLKFVIIVVFPDQTRLLFLWKSLLILKEIKDNSETISNYAF